MRALAGLVTSCTRWQGSTRAVLVCSEFGAVLGVCFGRKSSFFHFRLGDGSQVVGDCCLVQALAGLYARYPALDAGPADPPTLSLSHLKVLRVGSNPLFRFPWFALELARIRRPVVQIKTIEKDGLLLLVCARFPALDAGAADPPTLSLADLKVTCDPFLGA